MESTTRRCKVSDVMMLVGMASGGCIGCGVVNLIMNRDWIFQESIKWFPISLVGVGAVGMVGMLVVSAVWG